jgi:MazG family protein
MKKAKSMPNDQIPTEVDFGEGTLDRALEVVRFLRSNCPWDEVQTPSTLIPHLLEETHECVDAIRAESWYDLETELGDLLLNLAFQVILGEEGGRFTAESVTARLEDKMRRRHPHLFGLGEKEDWEALKARERASGDSVLSGLATGLDPLLLAHRIQDRVAGVGFDWAEPTGAWEKVREELEEVRSAMASESRAALEEELGDLLFAVVNLVRLCGAHSAPALDSANRKFRRRFERLEEVAESRGVEIPGASLEELDTIWDDVKRTEGTAEDQ